MLDEEHKKGHKSDKKFVKKIIKAAKKHPDWYTPEEVKYVKLFKKYHKKKRKHDQKRIEGNSS